MTRRRARLQGPEDRAGKEKLRENEQLQEFVGEL